MGNATLVRATGSEADAVSAPRAPDAARLAEFVSALSGCSVQKALDLVQQQPIDDPLETLVRSLCKVLPKRR